MPTNSLALPGVNRLIDFVVQNVKPEWFPTAGKLLVETSQGKKEPITEKDFSPEELSALRNLIGVSDRRGYVTYSDYLKAFDAERARTGKLPMSHTPSILSMFDPTGNLQTSLGRFTYENTPEGLIVHDVYDFNPISDKATETDKEVTQLLGSVLSPVWAMRQYAGEKIPVGSGRTVRINLGK